MPDAPANPLLADWQTPFTLPPFASIADADFAPAFDAALDEARAAIAAISDDPATPDFANTIAALERSEKTLDRVAGVFFNLASADANPDREALQRDLAPKLSAFSSEITRNRALFDRIQSVWDARTDAGLTAEQERVLMLYRRMFLRSGAALEGQDAERLANVKSRLAVLGTKFTQNLLADERGWSMDLSSADLAGLPDWLCEALRAAGQDRGRPGPVVTLSRSLMVPFLQFSPRRDLRRIAWTAWTSRGANGGATDNRAIAAEILALRAERAALLGHPDFASYKLETEMARTPTL